MSVSLWGGEEEGGIIPSSLCLLQLHQPQANRKENQAPSAHFTSDRLPSVAPTRDNRSVWENLRGPQCWAFKKTIMSTEYLTAFAIWVKLMLSGMTSLLSTGEDVLVKQQDQFSLTELLWASVDQTPPGCDWNLLSREASKQKRDVVLRSTSCWQWLWTPVTRTWEESARHCDSATPSTHQIRLTGFICHVPSRNGHLRIASR